VSVLHSSKSFKLAVNVPCAINVIIVRHFPVLFFIKQLVSTLVFSLPAANASSPDLGQSVVKDLNSEVLYRSKFQGMIRFSCLFWKTLSLKIKRLQVLDSGISPDKI
jgi:hypothetical protein